MSTNNSGSAGKGTSKIISADEHNETRRAAKARQKNHARKGGSGPQHGGNFLQGRKTEERNEFHKLHALKAIDLLEQDKLHGLARSLVVAALSNFALNSDLTYDTAFKQALDAMQESRVKEDLRPLSANLIEFAERKFTNVMNHAYSLAKGQQDEDRVAIEMSNGVLAYTSG